MKQVRLKGTIEIKIDVPDIITLEELDCKFKEHAKKGKYFLKSIKLVESKKVS